MFYIHSSLLSRYHSPSFFNALVVLVVVCTASLSFVIPRSFCLSLHIRNYGRNVSQSFLHPRVCVVSHIVDKGIHVMYVCTHVCMHVCITFSFYVDTSCPHCPDSPTVDFIPFLFFRSILPLSLGAFLGQGRWRKGDAGSHSKRAAVCLIEAPGQGRQEANIEAFFTPFVASHPTANAMPRYDPVSTTLFACFRDLF